MMPTKTAATSKSLKRKLRESSLVTLHEVWARNFAEKFHFELQIGGLNLIEHLSSETNFQLTSPHKVLEHYTSTVFWTWSLFFESKKEITNFHDQKPYSESFSGTYEYQRTPSPVDFAR